jgi:hypothetical protein
MCFEENRSPKLTTLSINHINPGSSPVGFGEEGASIKVNSRKPFFYGIDSLTNTKANSTSRY